MLENVFASAYMCMWGGGAMLAKFILFFQCTALAAAFILGENHVSHFCQPPPHPTP